MTVTYFPASVAKGMTSDEAATLRGLGILPIVANDIYIENRFRPERIQISYGGSGSGKSDWKATELLLKCMLNPYCRVLFLRKFQAQVRDSQYQLFKDVSSRYGISQLFKFKDSEMDIICLQNGNILMSGGLDDVDKLKSIPDITDIWIEEPIDRKGSVSSSDFTELDRRLRSIKASNHIHLTFNPVSKESWIYDYFFRSDSYMPFRLKTTYLDNYFAPPEQARQFEVLKERKPDEYAVYALGEWGSLKQGLVFPEYEIVDQMPQDCKKRGLGLDWGFYPDPTALIECGIKGDRLILDELIYSQNLTSATRAEEMRKLGIKPGQKIIADRNPEAIEEMRGKGFNNIVPADKGAGSIKAGIDIMKNYKICITARSKNLKAEFDNYEWERSRVSDTLTGVPIDKWNHGIDAARYWVLDTIGPKIKIHY